MLIGEVAQRSGLSVRMLRHYDALGLVRPSGRTSGGYREYSEVDVRRLFHVESLRTFGLSLAEVGRALDEPEFSPTALVDDLVDETRRRIAADTELLTRLLWLRSAAPSDWGGALSIVALLHGVESESGGHRQQAVLTHADAAGLPAEALAESLLAEDDLNVAGALRWALVRAEGNGLPTLATGLRSPQADVRRRAVLAVAAIETADSTALLLEALQDSDAEVYDLAALTLGARGCAGAVPTLAAMVAQGRRDVEAGDVLSVLAAKTVAVEAIVDELRRRVADEDTPEARLRLVQALAEIDGAPATSALDTLTADDDPTVAATASVLRKMRAAQH